MIAIILGSSFPPTVISGASKLDTYMRLLQDGYGISGGIDNITLSMTGPTVSELDARRTAGNGLMQKHKYDRAAEEFTIVIEKLCAENEHLAVIKMQALNGRAQCYIELERYDEAIEDTLASEKLHDCVRPHQSARQVRRVDALRSQLHIAFSKRGSAYAKKGNVFEGLEAWDKALEINPNGEAKDTRAQFFMENGIPPIDVDDETLKPFSGPMKNLCDQENLLRAFHEIVKHLKNRVADEEEIKMVDEKGIGQMMLGILNFYLNEDEVCDIALTIAGYMVRYGAERVWLNYEIIGKVMEIHKENADVMRDVLQFFACVPARLYEYFSQEKFIDIYMTLFNLDGLERTDILFRLMFEAFYRGGERLQYMAQTAILEHVFTRRTSYAFLLLSRLVMVPELCSDVRGSGEAIPWFEEIMAKPESDDMVKAAAIVIVKLLLSPLDESEDPACLNEIAEKCIRSVVPLIRQLAKNLPLVRELIDLSERCISYAKEEVVSSKLIHVVSSLLALNMDQDYFAYSSVEFLYGCAKEGLTDGIKEVPQALPNVMKVLDKYAESRRIAEKCVAFSIMMDHPNKVMQLQAGLRGWPDSEILKAHLGILDIAAIVDEVTGVRASTNAITDESDGSKH